MPHRETIGEKSSSIVYLVHGSDGGLVSQELTSLLDALVADEDGGLTPVEEYGAPGDDGAVIGPALDACRTPPFLSPRRIVVLREAAALDAAQLKEIVAYIAEPLESTTLVLAHTGRKAPAALLKAVRAAGSVIEASPASTSRARSEWFSEHIHEASVRLDQQAAARLQDHLGEDLARLEGTLATLEVAFAKDTTIHVADLEPFLGSAGGIAPWDLTDALDRGDAAGALGALDRLLSGGERHPLQIIAVLHRHYGAMLRLDGAEITDEKRAAEATGMSPYPAKKALAQTKRLGHERVNRAIQLLGNADLDVRGRMGWPPEYVLEVLVARLAQLVRLTGSSTRASQRPR